MRTHFRRILNVAFASSALLAITVAVVSSASAQEQESAPVRRKKFVESWSHLPKPTIVEVIPILDSIKVATMDSVLSVYMLHQDLRREEQGLSVADLKVGDGVSFFEEQKSPKKLSVDFNRSFLNLGAKTYNDFPTVGVITSLKPLTIRIENSTFPEIHSDIVSSAFLDSSTMRTTFGAYINDSAQPEERAMQVLKGQFKPFVTVTQAKPKNLSSNVLMFRETEGTITVTVENPDEVRFTRSTAIKFSDLAAGQTISISISMEPSGRVVCDRLRVLVGP